MRVRESVNVWMPLKGYLALTCPGCGEFPSGLKVKSRSKDAKKGVMRKTFLCESCGQIFIASIPMPNGGSGGHLRLILPIRYGHSYRRVLADYYDIYRCRRCRVAYFYEKDGVDRMVRCVFCGYSTSKKLMIRRWKKRADITRRVGGSSGL
jgi:transcription elongation factor Elf1